MAHATQQRRMLALFGLMLAVFLLYAPSLGGDFVWDDRSAATAGGSSRNPLVAELRPLGEYLTGNWWPQHNPHAETYRPLTTFWFALRHALVGDDAVVAHLLSVLLHTACTGLTFALLRALRTSFRAAWCGAAVFGVHALHGEAVATIVGQAELLGFLFGALGALAAVRALRGTRPLVWLLAVLVAQTAACFSKESALCWLGFTPMVALVAVRPPRIASRRGLALVGALALPCLGFLLLRARMLATLPPNPNGYAFLDNPLAHLDTAPRLLSALVTWAHGLWLTVCPWPLAIEYGPGQLPLVHGVTEPLGLVALATLAGLCLAARHALRLRCWPRTALAAAAFLGFTLPISNLPAVVFMQFAERAYFTPTLALALLAAAFVQTRRSPRAARGVAILLAVWLCASATLAVQRQLVWHDERSIVEHGVAESPHSLRMNLCAGALARGDGDVRRARTFFERAAAIDPASPQPWFELAELALRDHRHADAERALATARAGRPREVARYRTTLDALEARLAAAAPR